MASSSDDRKRYEYDVFLSFSGEDVRRTFIDHLYAALEQQGIHTFKDDEKLTKGMSIKQELLKSIENSRFCIIVFSKKYASSSWCLDELVKIMECHQQTAYPVFYDVDPTEVRNQSGSVGEALAKHTKKKVVVVRKGLTINVIGKALAKIAKKKLRIWREVMTEAANLSGWDLRNTADGHEAKVIKLIVERLSLELRSININTNIDENLVGMEDRIQDLEYYMKNGLEDVRMIGIKGMGGAGKTTLARAIFEKVSCHFDAKIFIDNVRGVSKESSSGLLSLQEQLLSKLLNNQSINLSSIYEGKHIMKERMHCKKVLVVLDDVDHISQLEALTGEPKWYKSGSRVLITTRDEQVLMAHSVKLIHDVNLLSDEEATHLFIRHAFGKDIPLKEYEMESIEVVRYAAGLPLTVKVLGSLLCGKDKSEWIDTLARLKTIPLEETVKKLELSYESLEDEQKQIFLDVACLLKNWKSEDAIRVLDSCGFHAQNGLRVLQRKSLITIVYDRIRMHDHIEEMGKNIVRRLHPDDPCRHSRLWFQEEIEDILASDSGTEETRCIRMELTPRIMTGLQNMKKLRCLIVDYQVYNRYSADDHEVCKHFPNALRYLYWYRYPYLCFPKTFGANYLVALEIYDSKIEQLWEGGKVMKKLKYLVLHYTKMRTCDLGLFPNLQRLDLTRCEDLVELHVPTGCLKRLVELKLEFCYRLKSLSFIKQLESLESLKLMGRKQREFPDIIPSHSNSNLLYLNISYCGHIAELPLSIGNLCKLVNLNLVRCESLKSLSRNFCRLQHLRYLVIDLCGIEEFPLVVCQLEFLEELSLQRSDKLIKHLPDSICMLKHLKILHLTACNVLEKLPEDLGKLESLEVLDLSMCESIREIPSSICMSKHLKTLILEGCFRLEKLPDDLGQLESLEVLNLRWCNIREIPSSICKLKHLKKLILEFCWSLKNLPEKVGDLECLQELDVTHSGIHHLPPSISFLKALKIIGFHP